MNRHFVAAGLGAAFAFSAVPATAQGVYVDVGVHSGPVCLGGSYTGHPRCIPLPTTRTASATRSMTGGIRIGRFGTNESGTGTGATQNGSTGRTSRSSSGSKPRRTARPSASIGRTCANLSVSAQRTNASTNGNDARTGGRRNESGGSSVPIGTPSTDPSVQTLNDARRRRRKRLRLGWYAVAQGVPTAVRARAPATSAWKAESVPGAFTASVKL